MSNSLKVSLYAVLILIASVSGYFALVNFGRMMARAGDRHSELEQIEPERRPASETTDSGSTTNLTDTNTAAAAATNLSAQATNLVSNVETNTNTVAAASTTNGPAPSSMTNTEPATAAEAVPPPVASPSKTAAPKGGSHLGLWTALFVGSLIGLGLLIASDVSHYLGNRALKVMYNDEGAGAHDPEYDKAEEIWANGDHLEAIKMMREYLAKNPREQHVAIRIAEIYEKDLKNNLAAALEYEEVLKHKLPPERWGWAAIHLCNLYFRLNQEQKGFDLLRKIVNDFPNTAAAEKARKRLEQVDGSVTTEQIATEPSVSTTHRPSSSASAPASNLPPGFRPKK
jgi:TolA-binding protein